MLCFRLPTSPKRPDTLFPSTTLFRSIYMNLPVAGGATRFNAIDKTIHPETGKLLAWNNRRPDGLLNPATLHHGMKVRSGTKYIITKWFRERPWPRPRTEPEA